MTQLVLAFAADLDRKDKCGRLALTAPTPSGALIGTVLAFADVQEERDDGLVRLALSPERLADADLRSMLGDEAGRAADVAILWNEREQEVVHVYDAATMREPVRRAPSYADLKLRADRGTRYAPQFFSAAA